MTIVTRLLKSITRINNSYTRILDATGENFNIFQILKMESNEVRLHSALIAELLNTNGSHGQKDLFLKSFIKAFNVFKIENDRDLSALVVVEEYAGKLNIEDGTGGRMDIVVKINNNNTIVIENKINAPDQDKQLIRYHNRYSNAHLIYLTLDGKRPDKYSIENNKINKLLKWNIDYFTASYREDILKWLVECRKQSVQHPLLRETITQYINLIRYMTGQTINTEKQENIVDTITENGQNITAAIETAGSINAAKKKLLSRFAIALKEKVSQYSIDLKIEIDRDFGDKFCGIKFSYPSGKINWLQLSFLGPYSFTYLEIYNDLNYNPENNKIEKNKDNIIYYQKALSSKCSGWGKIENVDKGWHGDWVCRYHKLDNHLSSTKTWAALANKDMSLADEISEDIITLLKVLR